MGIQEEYELEDKRKAALTKAVEAGLSDREKDLLHACFYSKIRDIKRKRSWRLSEQAMAIADVKELASKMGVPL